MNYNKYMPFFFIWFLFFANLSIAQKPGENQKISIQNFKLKENVTNFMSEQKGIECEFDVHFSEIIKDFFKKGYRIYWQLKDANGNILFNSEESKSMHNQRRSVQAEASIKKGVDLFLAYKEMDFPSGNVECKLVLGAYNDIKDLPNFWSKDISFKFKKIAIQPFEKQKFTIKNLKFETFSKYEQKVKIDFDMHLAYGPNEIDEEEYDLYWELLDDNGKEFFNSSQDFFTERESIYLRNFKKDKDGSYFKNKETGLQYKHLKISGKQDISFILYVVHQNKKIKIHEEKATVNFPELHKYEDQKFEVSNIQIKPFSQKGVSGVQINFDCKFKYNKISNAVSSDSYFFYAEMMSNQKKVFKAPSGAPYKNSQEHTSITIADLADKEPNEAISLSLFVPYFWLNLEEGKHDVEVFLFVTSSQGRVQFDDLGSLKTSIQQPQMVKATFTLSELLLDVNKEYDVAIGDNYTKRKPDTQWMIMSGRFYLYEGLVNDNSYEGINAETELVFTKGEKIELVIIDKDNFFNPNDVLLRQNLLYENKLIEVYDFHKDAINKLTYTLRVIE